MFKNIMFGDEVSVGDIIICDGDFTEVIDIIDHTPGTHKESPIHDHLMAREFVTNRGSRWRGYALED